MSTKISKAEDPMNVASVVFKEESKYLVVSYDDDQQQWFWDFVTADSEDAATAFVCKHRSYVIAANAISSEELAEVSTRLAEREVKTINKEFRSIAKQ